MSLIMTQSPLAANLACLGGRNEDVAEAIRGAEPPPDLRFTESGAGSLTADLAGRALASRRHPLQEAEQLADTVDVVENAAVVVLGFGLGYHVAAIARRLRKTGLVVVFEPDLGLLRAVLERIDHSAWLKESLVVFVTAEDDRGALARKLESAEAIIGQGVAFLEHPASRRRLGERSRVFTGTFSGHITGLKTTLMTTLVRTIDTVRNLLRNVDRYAGGPGANDLAGAAAGCLGVVVSAGPSLGKNMHLLAKPGVRDRCVIIAVQTTLKPLLAAGIRPHFVTALDYHEISRRFYEGLTPADVRDTTLVVDPKAHPAILDGFPGPVRCCANGFLDRLLGGGLRRDMGALPLGATVSHLAVYLARWLGCSPIAMIGQDLGFPDGLYYAPGAVIHDVWAGELNPFNTIPMMEWQRIVRFRVHLHRTVDVHGRAIYTDAQMRTYLQQFERDFAGYEADDVDVIDATEGGVVKQHARALPLAEVLDRSATRPIPLLPIPAPDLDAKRLAAAERRLATVERDITHLRDVSGKTREVIEKMIRDQADQLRMVRHFEKIERYRQQVGERMEAFDILGTLNQLGTFKRLRADRRMEMKPGMQPMERQRAQLDRDLDNVTWIKDAADEMIGQLEAGRRILRGEKVSARPLPVDASVESISGDPTRPRIKPRVAVLVPIDPRVSGLGIERSLAEPFGASSTLQATLERLGAAGAVDSIILIAPRSFDVDALIDRGRIAATVEVERIDGSPFGPGHEAVAVARLWARTSWRGGIAGMSVYDEIVCPDAMHEVMTRRGLTAALLAAPDWPLVDTSAETGADAMIGRYREFPQKHTIVFSQAPPGLSACLVTEPMMKELRKRSRIATVGGLLSYQPHMPQEDPISRDGNVQVDHAVRGGLLRASFDSERQRRRLREALRRGGLDPSSPASIVAALERVERESAPLPPEHVILELTPRRASRGILDLRPGGPIRRGPLTRAVAERIFDGLGSAGDVVITFAGVGDPLLHEDAALFVRLAREAGVRAVHVRSELLVERAAVDRLLEAEPDVISVDLHADRAETYARVMGVDRFAHVIGNMEHLIANRRHGAGPAGPAALALPWIVPRLQRGSGTYEDLESFFERWQHVLGTAVIEPRPPVGSAGDGASDDDRDREPLMETVTPVQVERHESMRRMTIYSDGSVPVSELDLAGDETAGSVAEEPVEDVWARLFARRAQGWKDADGAAPALRMLRP